MSIPYTMPSAPFSFTGLASVTERVWSFSLGGAKARSGPGESEEMLLFPGRMMVGQQETGDDGQGEISGSKERRMVETIELLMHKTRPPILYFREDLSRTNRETLIPMVDAPYFS